jgi:hypothetical protein
MDEAVRWSVKVSRETDSSVRSYLGTQAKRKGGMSRFVEEAVRWRILDRTSQGLKERNRDLPAAKLQTMIDQAVRETRAQRRRWAR